MTRNNFIDICKGFGILLVLYGHALEIRYYGNSSLIGTNHYQWKFIYSFHMPLFYFLSGLLYKEKPLLKVLQNSLAYILLALIAHLIGCLIKFLFALPITYTEVFTPLITWTVFSTLTPWYLISIALVQLIFHTIRPYGNYALILCIVSITSITYTLKFNINYFQYASLGFALFFYWIGFIGTSIAKAKTSRPSVRCCLITALLLTPLAIYLAQINQGCSFRVNTSCANFYDQFSVLMVTGEFGFIPLFLVSALLGITLTLLYAMLAEKLLPTSITSRLLIIGQNTVPLLIINGIFLTILQPFWYQNLIFYKLQKAQPVLPLVLVAMQLLIAGITKDATIQLVKLCLTTSDLIIRFPRKAFAKLSR